MSNVLVGVLPLTSDDIAAARGAESVQFRRDYDGEGCLKLELEGSWQADSPRIFTAREQRLFPHVNSSSGSRYRKLTASPDIRTVNGNEIKNALCHYQMRADGWRRNEWQTIVRAFRVGDRLGMRWTAGNDYPLIAEAGLHRDELRLLLHRTKNSPVFLIDAVVSADNTARIIRY